MLFSNINDMSTDVAVPEFFGDLHMDSIVEGVVLGRDQYRLKPFFYQSLSTKEAIQYRHDVMWDLENTPLGEYVRAFAACMNEMRGCLDRNERAYYVREKQAWFLEAVGLYCDGMRRLTIELSAIEHFRSHAFQAFFEYVTQYVQSESFIALEQTTEELRSHLAEIQYNVLIKGNVVTVRPYADELDYRFDVEQAFQRFRRKTGTDTDIHVRESREMNHVEARILDQVARIYPDLFDQLDHYYEMFRERYQDLGIVRFDREMQFYIAYIEFMQRFKERELCFSYPEFLNNTKEVRVEDEFDLALALKLLEIWCVTPRSSMRR